MLTERQQELLRLILSSYVRDAEPIASASLAERLREKVSSATIRNEFAALEAAGYIYQPHTSAGRIPTAKAYQFYLENYLDKNKELNQNIVKRIANVLAEKNEARMRLKNIAKLLAEFSGQAVVVAFEENDNYYTGLSNLFSQPEFSAHDIVVSLTSVIDHLDKVMEQLMNRERTEVEIMLSEENPFGRDCSAIIGEYNTKDFSGVIAIVGPTRMDYQHNYSLIKEIIKLLK
jgi:heat-inducible transcriptional repressor